MGANEHGNWKKQPNGKKIVELRQQKGLKQELLARDARISERLLRDIERRNKPVAATTITAIATLLGATAPEITLSMPDKTSEASGYLLKLRAVRSASELNVLARNAERYDWKLKVDPSVATAEDMRQVMTVLHRFVRAEGGDEFDGLSFGEIPRVARLQELLEKLRANGVGVLAGSYYRRLVIDEKDEALTSHDIGGYVLPSTDKKPMIEFVNYILVYFVPSEVEEEVITLDHPPLPDDENPF